MYLCKTVKQLADFFYFQDKLQSGFTFSQHCFQILKQTIHCVVLSLKGEGGSLLEEVAAIHVAYQIIKSEVYWFVQLSQHFPDVIHDVPSAEVKVPYSGGEMVSTPVVN